MDVVETPIHKLVPYARNPRHNEDAIATVAASLAEFGWRQPIVVDEDMVIVVGHTRYEAAKRIGMTSVPVHVAHGLTPAQLRAYRLMDNRSHQNASWDDELLKLELADLKLDEFDLALTGFEDDELARLLAEAPVRDWSMKTRSRSRLPGPSPAAAISGSSETTACYAAIPPRPRMSFV